MSKPIEALMAMCPQGVEIRQFKNGPAIRIDFRWQGVRCRETLPIAVSESGIRYAANLRTSILSAIERGVFHYEEYFPKSAKVKRAQALQPKPPEAKSVVDVLLSVINDARQAKLLSPSTIAFYMRQLKAQIEPKWGDTMIQDVRTSDVREWIIGLSKTLKPKSIRNTVGVFSLALGQAFTDGLIPSNPLKPLKLRKLVPKRQQKDKSRINPFNDLEIKEILDIFKTVEERSLWQFAFATGLRTGELIALKWKHVDQKKQRINVIDNIVTAERGTVEKDTKTGNERVVPILPGAQIALANMQPLTGKRPTNFVFINPRTRERWKSDRALGKCWERNIKRTTVAYRNPYQTRHTFASKLLEQGEQELLVAQLLGHTNVEMVRRHYGRYIQQGETISLRGDYGNFGTE